jgi:FlaA1/EpsC-like NDP-sugar epimerase
VVPLFRRQIAEGGPITLTHPEIIRCFMTIPETAQLVLLSGLSLRDAVNPGGDIEIVCTGLRPGEKLYEELLIDAESKATAHPLIYRARERAVPPEELWPQIDALEAAIERQDVEAALGVLAGLVPEWKRAGEPGGMTEAPSGAEAAAGA